MAQAAPSQDLVDTLARTPLSVVLMWVAILSVVRVVIFPSLIKTPPHLRTGSYPVIKALNEFLDAVIYSGVIVFMLIRPFGVQTFKIPSGSMWPTLDIGDYIVANKFVYRVTDPKPGEIVVFRPPLSALFPGQFDPVTKEVKVDFIKRCIGTPGQVIELREGILYRDGKRIDEAYRTYSRELRNANGVPTGFEKLTDEERNGLRLASFKLVNYKGRIIPLNYTSFDANSAMPMMLSPNSGGAYSIAQEFQLSDPEEMDAAKALPAVPVPPGYYLMMGDNRNGSFDSRGWGLVPREDIVGRSEVIWMPLSRAGFTR